METQTLNIVLILIIIVSTILNTLWQHQLRKVKEHLKNVVDENYRLNHLVQQTGIVTFVIPQDKVVMDETRKMIVKLDVGDIELRMQGGENGLTVMMHYGPSQEKPEMIRSTFPYLHQGRDATYRN